MNIAGVSVLWIHQSQDSLSDADEFCAQRNIVEAA
jgi:hypothetical protein